MSQALINDIVAAAKKEFENTLMFVLIGGSRVKGTARDGSDLDVHIVHLGQWYQKRFVGASKNEDGVDIDFSINPENKLIPWILRFRGYADFYSTGRVVYPNPSTVRVEQVLELARRVRSRPPASGFESLDHYRRYGNLRRTLLRSRHGADSDRKLALALVISGLAELRLVLAGDHHIRAGNLISKVAEVDAGLACNLQEALGALDSDASHRILSGALALLKPVNDFYLAEKLWARTS